MGESPIQFELKAHGSTIVLFSATRDLKTPMETRPTLLHSTIQGVSKKVFDLWSALLR